MAADTLIIGGGIIGCALAYERALHGQAVTVVVPSSRAGLAEGGATLSSGAAAGGAARAAKRRPRAAS